MFASILNHIFSSLQVSNFPQACSRLSVSVDDGKGGGQQAGSSREKNERSRPRFLAIVPTDQEPGTGYLVSFSVSFDRNSAALMHQYAVRDRVHDNFLATFLLRLVFF